MDDWIYPCPDVASASVQGAHLNEARQASEDRRHRAHLAEAARRAADLEETDAADEVLAISELALSAATLSGIELSR